MPRKPTCFDDIVDHKDLVEFLRDHLVEGTLPQFITLEEDEGLSKSPPAKILALEIMSRDPQALQRVINENKSAENILLYSMSINEGKDAAKEVETNLSLDLLGLDKKVTTFSEAHDMSDAAREAFLVSTEYLPKGVYLFVYITDSLNLKTALKSRAFTLHFQYLTQTEMASLLTSYVHDRSLRIQAEASTTQIITAWADGKPRIALNLIEGFVPGSVVPTAMAREFIDCPDAEDTLPLLTCLSGSMTQGLSVISEMKVDNSLVSLMVEILKVKGGMTPSKLLLSDTYKIRTQPDGVNIDMFTQFIYRVATLSELSRAGLISVFLQSYTGSSFLSLPPSRTEVLQTEMQQEVEASKQGLVGAVRPQAPSIQDLLQKGVVLGG